MYVYVLHPQRNLCVAVTVLAMGMGLFMSDPAACLVPSACIALASQASFVSHSLAMKLSPLYLL
jgi:hypothetical protein